MQSKGEVLGNLKAKFLPLAIIIIIAVVALAVLAFFGFGNGFIKASELSPELASLESEAVKSTVKVPEFENLEGKSLEGLAPKQVLDLVSKKATGFEEFSKPAEKVSGITAQDDTAFIAVWQFNEGEASAEKYYYYAESVFLKTGYFAERLKYEDLSAVFTINSERAWQVKNDQGIQATLYFAAFALKKNNYVIIVKRK